MVNSLGPEVNNSFRRLRLDMTGRLNWPGVVCHPAGGRQTKARPATYFPTVCCSLSCPSRQPISAPGGRLGRKTSRASYVHLLTSAWEGSSEPLYGRSAIVQTIHMQTHIGTIQNCKYDEHENTYIMFIYWYRTFHYFTPID